MTINRKPYYDLLRDRNYVDKDPDNEQYYVADVSAELTASLTTAVSCTAVVDRMTVLQGPQIQGTSIVVLVKGPSAKTVSTQDDAYVTLRVRCANGEQFDKTIWFNPIQD